MRIAYLNPWTDAAENQIYFSLARAGASVGVEFVACGSVGEVETSDAEFVLSVSSSIPKPVDLPSYLTVHAPPNVFLRSRLDMNNLMTYDGFLTISDSVERFVKDVCFATGRDESLGYFYPTPQTSNLTTDLVKVVREGDLRLLFLGTNWDKRAPGLLRQLDRRGALRIHGPKQAWEGGRFRGYAGPLPFDGEAPQRAYAGSGAGLVLLSDDHLSEDVISNRIFEIVSVGAVPICPSIPWIRKWFGNTVPYFTPSKSAGAMASEIAEQLDAIVRDPEAAQERALRARATFEERFAAEKMIANLVRYHEEVQQAKKERLSRLPPPPHISVVMRCGRHRRELLQHAIESVRSQTYGRFTLILAKFEETDVSELTQDESGPIESFVEVEAHGAARAEALAAGLEAVDTEYFAILDDDDFWLSDHIETLFTAGRLADPDFDVAFAGSVCVTAEPTEVGPGLAWTHNVHTFGFPRTPSTLMDLVGAFSSNCFIARKALLPPRMDSVSALETAEDSVVVALVCRRKRPVFSYRATAFFRRGLVAESGFANSASRTGDLLSLKLRTGLLLSASWLNGGLTGWQIDGSSVRSRAITLLRRVFSDG